MSAARRTLPNGLWGMALLVTTETALFGTLIGTYFYLRFSAPQWPPDGIAAPSAVLPLALAGALVLTTVPVLAAARAARHSRAGAAVALLTLALVVQAGYLAWQIVLFVDDAGAVEPKATAYGSVYDTLLFVHHAHVALGLLLSLWLIARLVRGVTRYRVVTAEVVALYWVFVAVVGIFVTATVVSPS
jgi:heme/copper-type cytochrome/quinol oxidase subunit 3